MLSVIKAWFDRLKDVFLPSGTFAYMLSFAGSFLLGALFTVESRRYLENIDFGLLSLLLACSQLSLSIANFGFYSSSVTRVKSNMMRPVRLAMMTSRITSSSLVLFVSLVIMMPALIAMRIDESFLVGCAVSNVVFSACTPLWTLQVNRRYSLFNILVFLQRFLFYIPSVLMLKLSMGLIAVSLAWAAAPIPVFVYYWHTNRDLLFSVVKRFRFPGKIFKTFRFVVVHEGSFMVSDMLGALVTSLPLLMLSSSASLDQVGPFAFLDRLRSYAVTIVSPLNSSQFNQVAALCSKKDFHKASLLMSRFLILVLSGYVLISVGLWITCDQLVGTYSEVLNGLSAEDIRIYIIGLPVFAISSSLALVYYSSQRLIAGQILTYFVRISTVGLLFLALVDYLRPIQAMCISLVFSEAFVTILIFMLTRRRSRLRFKIA